MQIYSYGLQPYYGYSNQDAVELIRGHQLLACPVGCPARLYALLVDCWHRVASTRPHFSVIRHRLRHCAADAAPGSGTGSHASATTAGCCGTTDGNLYPVCPPAACVQYDEPSHTQGVFAGHDERYNVVAAAGPVEGCMMSALTLADDAPRRWPLTANGDALAPAAGTEVVAPWSKQTSSAASRPCSAVNRSTTSTSAASTRNSHHLAARSSSSSASEPKSRAVTSSELDRLTSHPRPR